MATELRSYIDGNWHDGARLVDDINPANPSEAVAQVSMGNTSVAVAAVEAASAASAGWRRTPAPARGEILRKAADLLEQRASTVGRDLTREEGKTLVEGIGETKRAAAILRYYAGLTLEADGQTYPSLSPKTFLFARREPIGVVAAITPWNFPIAIPAWKIAPALAYGNTVVWKPAELVPLTATHLLQALVDAGLPKGVLNMVLGRGSEVGEVLATHQAIDAITFTGSNPVGRSIQRKATEHGKKVQLEMGGKNPSVVLADANLDHAAEQVARGAFLSAGQKCTATSRVIVQKSVQQAFTDRLVAAAEKLRVGDGLNPQIDMGPLVNTGRVKAVHEYTEIGKLEGAKLILGGSPLTGDSYSEGAFYKPTIFTDVSPSMRIATEEIFGPFVSIVPVATYEEAIKVANSTEYGLSTAVFTESNRLTFRAIRDIQSGLVYFNAPTTGAEIHMPFGGMKASGNGHRELGAGAVEEFSETKSIFISYPARR